MYILLRYMIFICVIFICIFTFGDGVGWGGVEIIPNVCLATPHGLHVQMHIDALSADSIFPLVGWNRFCMPWLSTQKSE